MQLDTTWGGTDDAHYPGHIHTLGLDSTTGLPWEIVWGNKGVVLGV